MQLDSPHVSKMKLKCYRYFHIIVGLNRIRKKPMVDPLPNSLHRFLISNMQQFGSNVLLELKHTSNVNPKCSKMVIKQNPYLGLCQIERNEQGATSRNIGQHH